MDSNIKVALVTGAGRTEGLGFEVCRQIAQTGCKVILSARDGNKAQSLADSLQKEGLDVEPLELDITSESSIQAAFTYIKSNHNRLDILVNNAAGIGAFGEQSANVDLQAAKALMDSILFGSWRMCQVFLPLLRESPAGRLVNVSSGAGSHADTAFGLITPNGMAPSYAVAKAALNALTAKLAYEEKSNDHLLINAVCPGFTATFEGGASMGARPVVDGAKSIVWGATLPANGPTGGFFRDGKSLPW